MHTRQNTHVGMGTAAGRECRYVYDKHPHASLDLAPPVCAARAALALCRSRSGPDARASAWPLLLPSESELAHHDASLASQVGGWDSGVARAACNDGTQQVHPSAARQAVTHRYHTHGGANVSCHCCGTDHSLAAHACAQIDGTRGAHVHSAVVISAYKARHTACLTARVRPCLRNAPTTTSNTLAWLPMARLLSAPARHAPPLR